MAWLSSRADAAGDYLPVRSTSSARRAGALRGCFYGNLKGGRSVTAASRGGNGPGSLLQSRFQFVTTLATGGPASV
jgi:hypothetical protein